MRRLIFLLFFLPVICFAQQRWAVTAFGGFSNYQGDLQSKPITLDQSNFAFGLGVKYSFTPNIAVRTGFNYGKIEAEDAQNKPSLQSRNLSFETKIIEGNLLGEYTLFDLSKKRFSPYAFAGVAVYHFNPHAFDTLGNRVSLQALGTEGQGLPQYGDRKPYKLTQFAIPFGAGIKLRINEYTTLGYEIGLRKLFTDYLDDVSKTYVDPFALAQARGAKAVEMSYRGGEVKGGDPVYPADGTMRGSPKFKDWYYFTGFTLSVGLGNFGLGDGGKNKMGCPKF